MAKRELVIRVDVKTLLLIGACLTIGVLGGRIAQVAKQVLSHVPHPSLHRLLPITRGPALVVLSDFESDDDLHAWKLRGVTIKRAHEHATHGQWAAQLSYPGHEESPAAILNDPFEDHKLPSNWSGYDELSFDLYNPQKQQERMLVQLKDADGDVYKQNLFLNPESVEPISVPLDDVSHVIRIDKIAQFNLFRWQPESTAVFYLDHLRLVRGAEVQAPEPIVGLSKGDQHPAGPVNTASGFVLGIENGATKIFKEPNLFQGQRTTDVHLSLARNEIEAFQVALYQSGASLPLSIERTDLVHDNGQARIGTADIRVRQVRYVKTEKPDYPVSYVGWWPDPLVDVESVAVDPGEVQPLWVTIRTQQETVPGHYRGTLVLRPGQGDPVTIHIDVTVRLFALPTEGHLKTAFDFYPARLRRGYEEFLPQAYEQWKDHMGELQHRFFLDLLEHRVSPIWSVDPATDTSFDTRITEYLNHGLTAFGIGAHGGSFDNDWPTEQNALDRMVQPYREMATYLRRQQLLSRAYVYTYDEPGVGDPKVAQAVSAIHWADPELKNLVVLSGLSDPATSPAWWKDIDIVCVRNTAVAAPYLDLLRQWKKEIWLYVSGPSHPYPTLVLDYSAMAARILPWMCWKARATGLLYWSVNYWTKDPWQDPANTKWGQNANGSLMYPGPDGPVDSIRLEVLRDGIEDYEYLYLLQQLVTRVKGTPNAMADAATQGLVAHAEQLLAIDPKLIQSMRSYSQQATVLEENRTAIAELIEQLQKVGQ